LGFWVWGLGFWFWGFGPKPKSPIPNPQSPFNMIKLNEKNQLKIKRIKIYKN